MFDPDEEMTVISADGIGRGVLRGNTIIMTKKEEPMAVGDKFTLNVAPGPKEIDNIIRFLRAMATEGPKHFANASRIMREGWPQLTPLQARLVLDGTKTLAEMLEVAKKD